MELFKNLHKIYPHFLTFPFCKILIADELSHGPWSNHVLLG